MNIDMLDYWTQKCGNYYWIFLHCGNKKVKAKNNRRSVNNTCCVKNFYQEKFHAKAQLFWKLKFLITFPDIQSDDMHWVQWKRTHASFFCYYMLQIKYDNLYFLHVLFEQARKDNISFYVFIYFHLLSSFEMYVFNVNLKCNFLFPESVLPV